MKKPSNFLRKIVTLSLIFSFVIAYSGAPLLFAAKPSRKTKPAPHINKSSRYLPGEIIIQVTDGNISSLNALNAKYRASAVTPVFAALKKKYSRATTNSKKPSPEATALLNTYKIKFKNKNINIPAVCKAYKNNPAVVYAEPNYIYSINKLNTDDGEGSGETALPNDTYVDPNQDGTWSTGAWGQDYPDMWGLEAIGMQEAWQKTHGSPEVIVAVSDTGLDYNHPDIQGNVWINSGEIPGNGKDDDGNGYIDDVYGFDFYNSFDVNGDGDYDDLGDTNDPDPIDDNGHGTHVSGTIAAATNNSQGVAGISWNAKIMAVKGLNKFGGGSSDNLAKTITYAVDNGAKIINMSWGDRNYSQNLVNAINYAYSKKTILVAAAGNDTQGNVAGVYPAAYPHVIRVAGWDHNNTFYSLSNRGNLIDLTAPGVDILSLRAQSNILGQQEIESGYKLLSGTSMAAPHICGVTALMLSLDSELSADLVRAIIQTTAQDVLDIGKDIYSGYGLLSADNALTLTKYGKDNSYAELLVREPGGVATTLSDSEVRVTAYIDNVSNVTVDNIPYKIYAGTPETGTLLYESLISRLLPYDPDNPQTDSYIDQTFSFNQVPSVVTLQIDPDDTIAEYNKINNRYEIPVVPYLRGWPQQTGGVVYSSPAVADLDPLYPGLEVVVGSDDGKVYAWHSDGTYVSGWPQTTGGQVRSSPAIADIDGDRKLEVVVGSDDGKIYAWHSDGQLVKNWPQTTADKARSSPAVADFDPTYKGLEVVIGSDDGKVYAWHEDGTNAPGWPVQLWPTESSPSLEDLDGDGLLELAIGIGGKTYVLYHDDKSGDGVADIFPGWPQSNLGGTVSSAPAVADIDADGRCEIIVTNGYGNDIVARHSNGNIAFRQRAIGPVYSSPVVADLNGDGKLETVVSSYGDQVLVFRYNGYVLGGWPMITNGQMHSSPAIADLDPNYPGLKIVVGAKDGNVYAFYGDGGPIPGWPQATGGEVNSSPAVADLDGNGTLEVIVGSDDGKVYVWSTAGISTERTPWPKFHHDLRNTGFYVKPVLYVPADYPTIQSAINAVNQDGAQIHVAPGIYNESINFKGKKISVIADQGPSVTTIHSPSGVSAVNFNLNETTASTLQGFTITTTDSNGISISNASPTITQNIIDSKKSSPQNIGINVINGKPNITSNTIMNWDKGLYLSNLSGYWTNTISNTIYQNNYGVYIEGSGAEWIERNLISNNLNDGIYAGGTYRASIPSQMLNNTVVYNGQDGIDIIQPANPTFVANIIAFNNGYGVNTNGFTDWISHGFNDFYGNGLGDGIGIGVDDIFLDPKFADSSYHLQADSSCIDTGWPFFEDPDGTRGDVGALYYQQNSQAKLNKSNKKINNNIGINSVSGIKLFKQEKE